MSESIGASVGKSAARAPALTVLSRSGKSAQAATERKIANIGPRVMEGIMAKTGAGGKFALK